MALDKLTTNLNIIQALDDEPNDVGGLTAAQLKAKFDEGTNAIKTYINDTLTTEIDSQKATKAELQGIVLGQIPDGTITEGKLATTFELPVTQGGTGATTASGALTELGALPLAGGTMTGALILSGAPTQDLQATTKSYVDSKAPSILYEKIRNITDASGTTSVSVDVSDIDWSVWREIRLIGKVGVSSGSKIILRVNNLSAANYSRTYTTAGSTSLTGGTSQNSIETTDASIGALTVRPMTFDISICRKVEDSNPYYYFVINKIIAYYGLKTGIASYGNTITLSTFNIISETVGITVSLSNASLWGIRL